MTLSKQQKLDAQFRIDVARKFGIEPISLRASRCLDKYCPSVEGAKKWAASRDILKKRNVGHKSILEIRAAFGLISSDTIAFGQQRLRVA
jgi:thioesterase domain-containing protein